MIWMGKKGVMGMLLVVGIFCSPAFSEESVCFNSCMGALQNFEECYKFCYGLGDTCTGSVFPSTGGASDDEGPTPQECEALWGRCREAGLVEQSECDALREACNRNWAQ